MPTAPWNLSDNPALLKVLIAVLQAENAKIPVTLRAHDQLIQSLRQRIAKLKKQVFGRSSEKIECEIEQLELALEDLRIATAESETSAPADGQGDDTPEASTTDGGADRPSRRRPRVANSTPRVRQELDLGSCCCLDCSGDLRLVGEDVSEDGPDCPAQKILPPLRTHGAGSGPQPPDPRQYGRPGPAGAYPRLQV